MVASITILEIDKIEFKVKVSNIRKILFMLIKFTVDKICSMQRSAKRYTVKLITLHQNVKR